MLKKSSPFAVAILILNSMLWPPTLTFAQSNSDSQLRERIRADVAVIGVGARVSIKLRDKKKLTGYISQVGENDFVVTKAKEGTKQAIAYADVTRIKQKNEQRVSTAGNVLIVWGALMVFGLIVTGGGG